MKHTIHFKQKNHFQLQNADNVVMDLGGMSMCFRIDEQYLKQKTRLCNKQLS